MRAIIAAEITIYMPPKEQITNDLRVAFDSLPGAVFLTNTEGEVLYANNTVAQKTGYDLAQIIGCKPGELWGGKMGQDFYAYMWSEIKDRHNPFVSRVINSTKTGKEYSEKIYLTPVLSKDKKVDYFLEVVPTADSPVEELQFDFEFKKVLSGQLDHGGELIEWLAPYLGAQKSKFKRTFRAIRRVGKTSKKFGEIVKDSLVKPTRKMFSNRIDDKKLILAAQRDNRAYYKLYNKYYNDIYYYFWHRLGSDKEKTAEDLAQDTFYRALRYLDGFRVTNASYLTYLLRIAHNLLVNFYRKDQMLPLEETNNKVCQIAADNLDKIDCKIMWQKVGELSESDKQIIVSKYAEGMSIHEIAVLLNKSDNAVKLQLSRARKKLKNILS